MKITDEIAERAFKVFVGALNSPGPCICLGAWYCQICHGSGFKPGATDQEAMRIAIQSVVDETLKDDGNSKCTCGTICQDDGNGICRYAAPF